jgi:hypothetical protein
MALLGPRTHNRQRVGCDTKRNRREIVCVIPLVQGARSDSHTEVDFDWRLLWMLVGLLVDAIGARNPVLRPLLYT